MRLFFTCHFMYLSFIAYKCTAKIIYYYNGLLSEVSPVRNVSYQKLLLSVEYLIRSVSCHTCLLSVAYPVRMCLVKSICGQK